MLYKINIKVLPNTSILKTLVERWDKYFWRAGKCRFYTLSGYRNWIIPNKNGFSYFFCLLDLHCCKLAADTQCEQACQDSLRRKFDSDVEAVESLEGRGCGSPSLDVSTHIIIIYNLLHIISTPYTSKSDSGFMIDLYTK